MQVSGVLSDNALLRALSGAAGGLRPLSPATGPAAVTKADCDCGGAECPTCGGTRSVLAVEDSVELSPAALAASRDPAERATSARNAGPASSELTEEEQKAVDELKRRDLEVRQHEAAHAAAAGPHASGGPSYEYETGPDGKRYAVGGEVRIDTSPVEGDPAATIAKMEQIRAAALAPADPSGQDRSVAARATAEIAKARSAQASGGSESEGSAPSAATGNAGRPDETPTDAARSDSRGDRQSRSDNRGGAFTAREAIGTRVSIYA